MNEWIGAIWLLLAVGVVFDVFLGKTIGLRKWLQGGLVALFLIALMALPRCGVQSVDQPDGPDIPYRF